jgi:hypothetical protein
MLPYVSTTTIKKIPLIHHDIDSIKFLHTNKKCFSHRGKFYKRTSHTTAPDRYLWLWKNTKRHTTIRRADKIRQPQFAHYPIKTLTNHRTKTG